MIRRHASAPLLLLLVCLACSRGEQAAQPAPAGEAPSSAGSGEVAAEVDGVTITTDQVDDWIKEDLFRRNASNPSELFELRQSALDAMITERVVDAEASKRGISADEVIAQEVAALGPVTDAEVKAFFDEHEQQLGGATLDQVGPRIRDFLTQRREADARRALREKATVVIQLEPPRVEVAADGPSRGPDDAPITIVEFSDFQCPFCRRAVPTLHEVMEKYPGKVRIVYRNLPLGSHGRARPAAEAALCAGEQGQFWAYHDLLFQNQRQLEDEDLARYAGEVGIDTDKFKACVDEKRFDSRVNADMEAARAAGVTGTPAFFVNGIMLSGAKPAGDFYRVIDAELARLGSG
jgi:protein-disulfide isomerase